MAHTSPHKLADLKQYLSRIGKWAGIKKKGVGIYYFKTIPFLHFHDKDGERWAHIKDGKAWTTVSISFDAKKQEKDKFFDKVEAKYEKFLKSSKKR